MINHLLTGIILLSLTGCGPLGNLSVGASTADGSGSQQTVIRNQIDFQLIGDEDTDEDKSTK